MKKLIHSGLRSTKSMKRPQKAFNDAPLSRQDSRKGPAAEKHSTRRKSRQAQPSYLDERAPHSRYAG